MQHRVVAPEEQQSKQVHTGITGIDRLLTNLTAIRNKSQRISRQDVHGVLRQMVAEIPYAFWVVRTNLPDDLFSDTPQTPQNLMLNEIVVSIGQNLLKPSLRDVLASLTKIYMTERKKTERAYATALMSQVFHEDKITRFSESARPLIKELSQSIIEKIINERQSRLRAGYKPRAVVEIIDPIIHGRIYSLPLDQERARQPLAFREFVSTLAQDAYDAIHNDAMLVTILKEKEVALEAYRIALQENTPSETEITHTTTVLRTLYHDIHAKENQLQSHFHRFLSSVSGHTPLGTAAQQVRNTYVARLLKALHQADQDISLYANEAALLEVNHNAFADIEYEVGVIQNLFTTVKSIQTTFTKNFLSAFAGKKTFNDIDMALIKALLATTAPQYSLQDVYTQLIAQLTTIAGKVSGLMSTRLRADILQATNTLKSLSTDIKVIVKPKKEFKPVFVAPEPPKPAPVVAPPKPEIVLEKVEIKAPKPAPPPPLPVEFEEDAAVLMAALEPKPEPIVAPNMVVPPEQPDEVASSPPPTVEPEPLKIDIEPLELETPEVQTESLQLETPKVQPDSLKLETPDVQTEPLQLETPEVPDQPLQLETPEIPDQPIQLETTQPTPEPESSTLGLTFEDETSITEAPAEPKPLNLEFEDEPNPLSLETPPSSANNITVNYQLGSMQGHVEQAWQIMSKKVDSGEVLSSDIEVRLYVICDLVQQVMSIDKSMLTPEQVGYLEQVTKDIETALLNPLGDSEWDVFEGSKRDNIDILLSQLL